MTQKAANLENTESKADGERCPPQAGVNPAVGWICLATLLLAVLLAQFVVDANSRSPVLDNSTSGLSFSLDINAATAAEFQTLPEVGPMLSQRIVAYRVEFGPFSSIDDLQKVRGVGPKTLDRLRDMLVIRGIVPNDTLARTELTEH